MKRAFFLCCLMLLGCAKSEKYLAAQAAGGDPARGKGFLSKYGCGACHTIPGVPGANAKVGPTLAELGKRDTIAGKPNSLENLMQWIRHPQKDKPGNPMPDQNIPDQDAKDIAAYLFSLR